MTRTLDYLIREVIEGDKVFKSIKYNKATNKIEMNGMNIHQCDYDDIQNECVNKFADTKFKKVDIKNEVMRYAKDHAYEPKVKKVDMDKFADWYKALKLDGNGKPDGKFKFFNLVAFFSNYPKYMKDGKNIFAYNEFTRCISVGGKNYEDMMLPGFKMDAELELGLHSNQNIYDAISQASQTNSFHPFKEPLQRIMWDGKERMESFFIDFLGVEDTRLNRSMTKKWFYAMMKRLYEPGCEFDNMLVVFDETQGTGKSKIIGRLIDSLGVKYGYSYNVDLSADSKETVAQLNQVWVQVIDELAKFIKKDPEEAKQFFSMNQDVARLAYGRTAQTYPRHCVFYGCTNVQYFLKDYSTNGVERRYWIMDAKGTPHDSEWWEKNLPYEYCRQVLAEAKYLYDSEPEFNYKTLSGEENRELMKIQDGHKTYKEDANMIYALNRVLDGKYSRETFDSYEMFYPEAKIKLNIDDAVDFVCNGTKMIDKIPTDWVKNVVEGFNRRNHLTTQYLSKLVEKNWEIRAVFYPGRGTKSCFVRKKSGEIGA